MPMESDMKISIKERIGNFIIGCLMLVAMYCVVAENVARLHH